VLGLTSMFLVILFGFYLNLVPSEEFSDEPFSDEEFSSGSEDCDDPEASIARKVAMDKLVPGLEPSEYGKMPPSFHSNSQRVAPTTIESDMVGSPLSPSTPVVQSPARTKPVRQPIIPRDRYDGVDSDDESEEEETADDDESDEDKPQVIGDVEIDMGEEEEEFLEFSRQALGITDDQWHQIIQDRQGRGGGFAHSTIYSI
jgi:hypothetical protein